MLFKLSFKNMKKSLFVYNEGTLQRHDNTIRFIDTAGNKK